MTYQVTIASGKKDVMLPNGSRYQAGAVVTLSDDEFGLLSPSAVTALFSAVSFTGTNMSRTVTIKQGLTNVVLPNGSRYSGGQQATLSDAQYSTMSPAARTAVLAGDVTVGGQVAAPARLTGTVSFPARTIVSNA
jgi:hypothetical protein